MACWTRVLGSLRKKTLREEVLPLLIETKSSATPTPRSLVFLLRDLSVGEHHLTANVPGRNVGARRTYTE